MIPPCKLPDPLTHIDGTPVTAPADWWRTRRPEILELFARHMYGRTPESTPDVEYTETASDDRALDGTATRSEITCEFRTPAGRQRMALLLYIPNHRTHPVPVFLGLNFHGNHTVDPDPAIALAGGWVPEQPEKGLTGNLATPAGRGSDRARWPVRAVIARGYGVATVYCGDLDPDYDDGFGNGVHRLFPAADGGHAPDAWGALGAWAWGLSRALDHLETRPEVDHGRVAVVGHSRMGKAALWAGAQDTRFAMVVSNGSGCGGAALARREVGERITDINTRFPHWFCADHHRYNDAEAELPVDQHMLLALIAPRPLYVASGTDDLWADPRGEFLAARHAGEVYRFLGETGLGGDGPEPDFPAPDTPLREGRIGYHLRTGVHEITAYDWDRYLDFADRHLAGSGR